MISLKQTGSNGYSVSGKLVIGGEKLLQAKLKDVIAGCKGQELKVDLSGLETVSSVVLAVLLSGVREAQRQDCQLSYINMSDYLFNMARVGGLEAVLFAS